MPIPRCSDAEFIQIFESLGAAKTARKLKIDVRTVHRRRRRIEKDTGTPLQAPAGPAQNVNLVEHPQRACYEIEDGVVLIGSDAHYWPNYISTAHRGFTRACEELKPKVVVLNGDVCDFARISRFPPQNWEHTPTLIDEIETAKERLQEILDASPNAKHVWTLGNHDARFEARLAHIAPEYALIHGVHLQDHFPEWRPAWACWINDSVVIKHRWKSGIHATHNNAMQSGKSMVTGHLHSLKVTPWTDYNGTRWGVDSGTLADTYGPQFSYAEDSPRNWRSGFAVLTFCGGEMLQPDLAMVRKEGEMEFRGKAYAV